MTTLTVLTMAAAAHPDRVAVTSGGASLTYAQLARRAAAFASEVQGTHAQHVALLDLNGTSLPVALFGSAMAHVPFVPLNFRLADDRLEEALGRVAPAVLYRGDSVGRTVTVPDGVLERSADLDPREGDPDLVPEPDPDSPAVYLFTSGTTGTPKIAVLRHRHLFAYLISTVEFATAGEDEAIMLSVPNYHIAGISSVLSSVYSGRRVVLLPSFGADDWVRTAAEEQVTHAMVVPTMMGRILDSIEVVGESLPHLRHLSYGGGRMPGHVVERAMTLLPHVDFVNAYGLTETSSTVTVLGPDEHREAIGSDDPSVRARLGSVGRPVPGIELEIRDSTGRVVGPGEPGEVFVRGDQVAGEYTSHSAVDEDGWYPTRDHGHLAADGFLYLGGRADDVIVRGGENIAPQEVEDVLSEHESVAAAAVVGVPDGEWGERVEAVVVVRGDAPSGLTAELQSWVRSRLRSSRVPAAVHVWTELPHNETGKLLRRVIREDLRAVGDQEVSA